MKILLIKLGGSIMNQLDDSFFRSLQDLEKEGYSFVFVHGGGPDINEMLEMMNVKPEFHNGLRKTTKDVLSVVELVLSGKTNRHLVSMLSEHGFNAMGLHGSDCDLLKGEHIDRNSLGEVGRVTAVNTALLMNVLGMGLIPVITPLAKNETGETLNINADMAAGAVARALDAESCVFVTDVKGVLDKGLLIQEMTKQEADELIVEGVISGGMIPKVNTAMDVLQTGIEQVRIVSGKETFFNRGSWIGTTFHQKVRASS